MVRLGQTEMPGMKVFVFSHSLRQEHYPHVTIVSGDPEAVATVELAIIPDLLSAGIPLLPPTVDIYCT